MMARMSQCVSIVALVLFPVIAYAECPDAAAVKAYVADYLAVRPSNGFGKEMSLTEANGRWPGVGRHVRQNVAERRRSGVRQVCRSSHV